MVELDYTDRVQLCLSNVEVHDIVTSTLVKSCMCKVGICEIVAFVVSNIFYLGWAIQSVGIDLHIER